jgi:MFS family permease
MEVGSQTLSIRPKLVAALLFAGTAAVVWVGTCVGIRLSDNVHVVESGLAVRSGQLWPAELEMVIADYGIRSIVSLVPAKPEQSWYRDEIAVSYAHGISRYEMPLSAGSELTLTDNSFWLIGVQVLDGVGAGFFGALTPLVIADIMRGTGRFNLAQGAIATAQGIGASLSGLAAGVIVDHFGYSAAFLAAGAAAAVALAVFALQMPETAERETVTAPS